MCEQEKESEKITRNKKIHINTLKKERYINVFQVAKMAYKSKQEITVKFCLIFENNKSKQNKYYSANIKINKIKRHEGIWFGTCEILKLDIL